MSKALGEEKADQAPAFSSWLTSSNGSSHRTNSLVFAVS